MAPRNKIKHNPAQAELLELSLKTAPCVPTIRRVVREWVENGYKGATRTTKQLLRYWFYTDHLTDNGKRFRYYLFQQRAIETLIYLYEIARTRRHSDLIETFFRLPEDAVDKDKYQNIRLLHNDNFARYCLKMATGTGKTKVLSLAIVWQYFNSILEDSANYARVSLLIAPNVIVLERLRKDFKGGRIFREDPLIPPEMAKDWNLEVYVRGDNERAGSTGALYLTNIQQLYDVKRRSARESDAMSAILGPKPPRKDRIEPFSDRLISRGGPILVANDEAHHTHDEDSSWNQSIRKIHSQLNVPDSATGIIQLDVSATPRYSNGSLFTWTIFDYPLKQAILDNVTKRPIKGIATGIKEVPSDIASVRYQSFLTAGVERWREYDEQLSGAPLNRQPVLFVMMNSTRDANEVADYLRTKYPGDFSGDNLLVIHTDKKGEVSKKDLEIARKAAQEIDSGVSSIKCIVSVLMLREGWDVQNITVVVGLRPFTSKASILPEQAIGRGLRLMFREPGILYKEHVDIIGNKAFIEFVEQLEKYENVKFDTVDLDKNRVTHPENTSCRKQDVTRYFRTGT